MRLGLDLDKFDSHVIVRVRWSLFHFYLGRPLTRKRFYRVKLHRQTDGSWPQYDPYFDDEFRTVIEAGG